MLLRRHHAILIVSIGPVVAGLMRKALPGQPVALEAAPLLAFVVLVVLGVLTIRSAKWDALHHLTWIWIALCAVYAIPASLLDMQFGAQAAILAIGAPLIGIAFLADPRPGDSASSVRALRLFVWAMCLQFPIGIVMLLFGNESLPDIFRANANEIAIGKEIRIGQPMLAGYFTTAPVNSIAALCGFGIACSLFLRDERRLQRLASLLAIVALLAVVWMTARRGALMACVLIACVTGFLDMRRRGIGTFVVLGIILPIGSMLVFGEQIKKLFLGERMVLLQQGSLDLRERLDDVFGRFLTYWIETSPFGNFTGYASAVGKAFDVRDLETAPAEVGAAMIVAEHGVLGLVLFTLIALVAIRFMVQRILRSGQYWCLPLVAMYAALFTLFYFKENSVLFPGFIGSLLFWATPGLVAMFTAKGSIAARGTDSRVNYRPQSFWNI